MKSPITTHVLDTALGKPAVGISIMLEIFSGTEWSNIGNGITNNDGRCTDLLPLDYPLQQGVYRITFQVGNYCQSLGVPTFYPEVPVIFEIKNTNEHYHVPLLISPFGYSTYRGS